MKVHKAEVEVGEEQYPCLETAVENSDEPQGRERNGCGTEAQHRIGSKHFSKTLLGSLSKFPCVIETAIHGVIGFLIERGAEDQANHASSGT